MILKPNTWRRNRSWPYLYTRTHQSGQECYVVDLGLISKKRARHAFKTRAEGHTFAQLKKVERSNQGQLPSRLHKISEWRR